MRLRRYPAVGQARKQRANKPHRIHQSEYGKITTKKMYLAVEMLENLRHQVRLFTKNHASESAQLPETAQKNNNLYSRNHHKRRTKKMTRMLTLLYLKKVYKKPRYL